MNWKRLVPIAAGLLLPLPLIIIGSALVDRPEFVSSVRGRDVSPILPKDEKRRLPTFERSCRRREDCDPPLVCLDLGGPKSALCVASECQTDLQCQEGFTCRVLPPLGGGPLVRFCVPEGPLVEGQACHEAPARKEDACQRGLVCAGWCGRPCHLGDPQSCPHGFFCEERLNGPSCLPSCAPGDCAPGRRCVHFRDRISACLAVEGRDCQDSPCPSGQECTFSYAPGEDSITMECVQPCGDARSACPAGFMCFANICRRLCDPDKANSCDTKEQCVFLPDGQLSLCYPSRG